MKKRKIIALMCSLVFMFAITAITFSLFNVNAKETLNDNYTDLKHIEDDDLYYTDSYFKQSATIYNPHLASLTMVMANSTGAAGSPKNMDDKEWFEVKQSERFSNFLNKISFTDFDTNEDYKKPTSDTTIGVGAAKKEIGDDTTVVAIGVRSSGYYREWANNMHLGTGEKSDYMHEGWYNAANKLITFLNTYVTNYVTTSKVKVWLTGFSRGGATANVAAGLLDNKLDKKEKIFDKNVTFTHDDLYAYTFEAPQGANVNSKTVKKPKDAIYNNIWNIVNPKDIVTKVAMSQYGFTRFGQDKYITNAFYDNDHYSENRYTYRKLLEKLTKDNLNPDDFVMYGLPLEFLAKGVVNKIMGGDFTILQVDETKNYDANIAETLLIEELTSHIGSRQDYVKNIQSYLEDVVEMLEGYEKVDKSKLKSTWPAMLCAFISGGILYAVTGQTKHIDLAAMKWAEWLKMDDAFSKKATKLFTVLVAPIAKTYWEKPNELISVAKYISQIFDNHNTEVTLAHVQAQDSFFVNAYNKAHPNDQQLKLVQFLDNADYGRMSFTGFNDIGLYEGNSRKINITGKVVGRSNIGNMSGRYFAGYYSYVTEEKMEIFFPLGTYKITMKDFSKKPYHTMSYAAYRQYISVNDNGETKHKVDSFEDWAIFISKRYERKNVNVNV